MRLVLFLGIWRYLASYFIFAEKLVLYIKKHAIKSDVTFTGLTNYKVSIEYPRVLMSESMAGSVTCTPTFVNYDIGLKDSLPP